MAWAFFEVVTSRGIQSRDFGTEYYKFFGLFQVVLDCVGRLILISRLMSLVFVVCYC